MNSSVERYMSAVDDDAVYIHTLIIMRSHFVWLMVCVSMNV